MPLTLRVHDWKQVGDGDVRIVSTKPFIRLFAQPGPPVFLQNGRVYYENGKPPEKLPAWFEDELAKCGKRALADVGFGPKGKEPAVETPDPDDVETVENPQE